MKTPEKALLSTCLNDMCLVISDLFDDTPCACARGGYTTPHSISKSSVSLLLRLVARQRCLRLRA
jgi:hypothetical protein